MEEYRHSIELEILNEMMEERGEEEGFVIDNDEKAEWALKKIAQEKAETQRYMDVCQAMIEEYKNKMQKEEEKLKTKISFLEGQLRSYFEQIPHAQTKTQETYKLPSGTLRLKMRSPEFKRNEEQILNWLKKNQMGELVKMEEKLDWAGLKKKIKIAENRAVTEDGEIIEGIEVIEREPVFTIDV